MAMAITVKHRLKEMVISEGHGLYQVKSVMFMPFLHVLLSNATTFCLR